MRDQCSVCILDAVYRQSITQDNEDVEKWMQREQRYTDDYNRMSRNKLWAVTEHECLYYDGSPEEYKNNKKIWPRGRHLHTISLYSQFYDFFLFMWTHTKPYKHVALILTMAIHRPLQTTATSYILQYIQQNPTTAPFWLYFINFYGYILVRFLDWQYQLTVPLESQRIQLRTVLLKQMLKIPHDHPLAYKWPSGRFVGLINDVDVVISDVWQSMLLVLDDLVTIVYLIVLCCLNLHMYTMENSESNAYGIYVGLFLMLGLLTMAVPFVWFHLFDYKVQECERMVRDSRALYMSASQQTYSIQRARQKHGVDNQDISIEQNRTEIAIAVKSYWLYVTISFRALLHKLAWETNYGIISNSWGPLVAYFLLTKNGFAGSMSSANILIIFFSLHDLIKSSIEILQYLIKMSRGCNALRDIAEILNVNIKKYDPIDIEKGKSSQV
jgi:ABC-type multidrug transport system fused ATPase/permease subunit